MRGFGRDEGRRSFGGSFKRDRNFGPRKKHKAVCADCKQDCEVPFKPIKGKPVYCKECYPKHRKFLRVLTKNKPLFLFF